MRFASSASSLDSGIGRAASKRLCTASIVVAILSIVSGCATSPATDSTASDTRAWVLGGAGELTDPAPPPLDLDSLLALDDEMRSFAHQAVATSKSPGDKLRDLVTALHSKGGLDLRYDVAATLTAREAFEQRRANCISHTLLFVALAREVGVDARFNHVDIPPIWDLRGHDLLLYRHINARIGVSATVFQIVDVAPEDYDPDDHQWVITDGEAQAQFLNNRAMELMAAGNRQDALRNQLRAISMVPDESFLWSNLGHLYLSMGNAKAAEFAIQTALGLDPDSLSAYGTAAHVYEVLDQPARAQHYRQHAQALLQKNPYYHYQLGVQALNHDEVRLAYAEVRRAIDLYPQDHRFFFLMGLVLVKMDKPDLATRSIQVAIQLSSDESQQSRYRSKLARLPQKVPES